MAVTADVRELTEVQDMRLATDLITRIWQAEAPPVPFSFMRALSHSGAQVIGGFVDGRLAGVAVGFPGTDADGPLLHSHVVGVDARWRGTGLGHAIKLAQRDWCLQRGIKRMVWTFDPLRVGNACFNLNRLGARGVSYHHDFYGPLDDGFNRGIPTDRVLVHWDLADAESGPRPATAPTGPYVLDLDTAGRPVAGACEADADGEVRLRVPARPPADPSQALAWRLALREAMQPLMRSGHRWTTAHADGTYVLTAPQT
ncbi:GNAT family N-acetyltransferase [Streptomyces coeruleorubidus]|uniref:GNAT family N-acetyltransferase n=1 Tax=Streptomyces coeruleorubidus TaxID=116188 RepID=UPI0036B8F0B1